MATKLSKKAKVLAGAVDREKLYGVDEAIALAHFARLDPYSVLRSDGGGRHAWAFSHVLPGRRCRLFGAR